MSLYRHIALVLILIFLLFSQNNSSWAQESDAEIFSKAQAELRLLSGSDAFRLSISVERAVFDPSGEIKVRCKIENKSGRKISLSGVDFNLHKYEGGQRCVWDECFSADYSFPKKRRLKNGEAVEFEVNLGDLYWVNTLSSTYDFTKPEPKNLLWVVGKGSYHLTMELYLPADDSTKEDPRSVIFKSNEVWMKKEGL